MKKKILLLFVIFITLFSCKKDSVSNYSENIIGKWQMSSAVPASDYELCDFKGFTNFNSNNTYSDFDECTNSTSTGKWRIQENILTLSDDEFPIPFDITIVSISMSNMTLEVMGTTVKYVKL